MKNVVQEEDRLETLAGVHPNGKNRLYSCIMITVIRIPQT